MKDLSEMSELELLQTRGAVIAELRHRGVVKTENNPIGDYTEWLVCKHLVELEIQGNSQEAFDAVDPQGVKYQIKGRRSSANSVQFSAIRKLDDHGFDFVVAVVFNEDYSIRFAFKIAYAAVKQLARYQEHTNSHLLILTEKAVELDGVEDITQLLA